jgi:hypothetical protein
MGRPPGRSWQGLDKPDGTGFIGQASKTLASLERGDAADILEAKHGAGFIDVTSRGPRSLGRLETLLVNSCLDTVTSRPNPGWLVDLDLDPADAADPADKVAAAGEADATVGSNPDANMTV